ncbi:MAG: hypothetical protein KatS3mg057_1460 [Herpetosiphonaceae bacterium]|nr:MAG: hypothetical protein KatS3mg057_1460 [Herpetosiphonaceae bacterium]
MIRYHQALGKVPLPLLRTIAVLAKLASQNWAREIAEWEETQEYHLRYVALTRARQELYFVHSDE